MMGEPSCGAFDEVTCFTMEGSGVSQYLFPI